jgi:predicted short-subunit dehydrogenase-like oxidoreductase (DUF2520 family)
VPVSRRLKPWRIAVIGAGTVGSVLGRLLVLGGDRVVHVVTRTPASARRAARFLRCTSYGTDLSALPPDVDLLLITTPHDAVVPVAREIAGLRSLPFKRIAACHASGMLDARALAPLRRRGATVFSFHPLQTFPRTFPPAAIVPQARNIFYGVDGTPAAVRRARSLARRLSGRVIEIPPARRHLYHAACVVASNHLTTMAALLGEMYAALGRPAAEAPEVFRPIIDATLANIRRTSVTEALSGPVARGGVGTVRLHLEAVQRTMPQLLPYFSIMTAETVRLARRKGSITARRAHEMLGLLSRARRSAGQIRGRP